MKKNKSKPKHRSIAWRLYPVHRVSKARGTAIVVNAGTYEEAKEKAMALCTLVKRFPNVWSIR